MKSNEIGEETDQLILDTLKELPDRRKNIGLTTKEIADIINRCKTTVWRHLIWLENRKKVKSDILGESINSVRVYKLT